MLLYTVVKSTKILVLRFHSNEFRLEQIYLFSLQSITTVTLFFPHHFLSVTDFFSNIYNTYIYTYIICVYVIQMCPGRYEICTLNQLKFYVYMLYFYILFACARIILHVFSFFVKKKNDEYLRLVLEASNLI